MVWVDDVAIGDEEVLWRRIAPEHFRPDQVTGERRRSDGAFRTQELSVHRACLANKETILSGYPTHRLVALTAGIVRAIGLIIAKDPTEDDPSHAIVDRQDNPGGKLTGAQATKLNNAATWVD
jgi:hypothetical protein